MANAYDEYSEDDWLKMAENAMAKADPWINAHSTKHVGTEDIEDKEQPMDFGSENLQSITVENRWAPQASEPKLGHYWLNALIGKSQRQWHRMRRLRKQRRPCQKKTRGNGCGTRPRPE